MDKLVVEEKRTVIRTDDGVRIVRTEARGARIIREASQGMAGAKGDKGDQGDQGDPGDPLQLPDGSFPLSKLAEPVIQADGGQPFTGDQSMGGHKLSDVAPGTLPTDGVNLAQLGAAQGDLNYLHDQLTSPSSTWTINHMLNKIPNITVLDVDGNRIRGQVTYTDFNHAVVQFIENGSPVAVAGQAACN